MLDDDPRPLVVNGDDPLREQEGAAAVDRAHSKRARPAPVVEPDLFDPTDRACRRLDREALAAPELLDPFEIDCRHLCQSLPARRTPQSPAPLDALWPCCGESRLA